MTDKQIRVKEIMNELRSLVDINLANKEEVVCPTCNGLRLYEEERNGSFYLKTCVDCYTGSVSKCEFCGKLNKTSSCDCSGYYENRRKERENRDNEILNKKVSDGNVISVYDYDSFVCIGDKYIMAEDLEEEIYNLINDEEDVNRYMYGTYKDESYIGLDLEQELSDKMEDGYEDMSYNFDFKDYKIIKAQELVNEWLEDNKGANTVIYEDQSVVIDLKEMIDKIKNDIKED